VTCEALCCS